MAGTTDFLAAAKRAFSETISLKMQQLYDVVPKNQNAALTGAFVEELVRGFVRQWIAPCLLMHGTLHPHDASTLVPPHEWSPKQIDGIVFDPRRGPSIIREGDFLVVHPIFCRGIVEIKTSCPDLMGFENRLQGLYWQYLAPYDSFARHHDLVMGIVIQDQDPERHSFPSELHGQPIHAWGRGSHCPVFILFREAQGDYTPYEPGIEALIRAVFTRGWQYEGQADAMYSRFGGSSSESS
jgi:hypothetical protein